MELGGHGAGLLVQQPVDHCVDVFVGRDWLRAVGDAQGHAIEPAAQCLRLVHGEDASLAECQRPGPRESHVVRPEAEVGADGAVDGVEQRRGAAGESTAPELMGAGIVGHRRDDET